MPHFDHFPRPGEIDPYGNNIHILQGGLPKQNQALPSYVHGKYVVFCLGKPPCKMCCFHMGQFLQDGENGQNVAFILFLL